MSHGSSTLFFGRMTPREALSAIAADLVARGALHPSQLATAQTLVDAGRLPATALLDIGTAADAVLHALATVTGLPAAPPRARWSLDGRAALAVPAATWQALLCVPIGSDGGRPLIAWADPSRLGSTLALSLPAHAPCAALEADIKDALAVSPAPQARSALSFLAPPSAVTVSPGSSSAFDASTRPALGGTLAGVLPPLTGERRAAPPSSSPPSLSPSLSPPSLSQSLSPPSSAPSSSSAARGSPGLSAVLAAADVREVEAQAALANHGRAPSGSGGFAALPDLPAGPHGEPPNRAGGTLVFGHATSPFSSTPVQGVRAVSPGAAGAASASLAPPQSASLAPSASPSSAAGAPSGQVTAFMSTAALSDAPARGSAAIAVGDLPTLRDVGGAAPGAQGLPPIAAAVVAQVAAAPVVAAAVGTSVDIGARCGDFVLQKRIGEGGMASVFLGVSESGAVRRTAIKIVHEHLLRSTQGEELRRRFQREADAMRNLRHDNIVALVDAGRIGGTEYLATEFIAGGTLSDLTRRTGKLPPLLAVLILHDLLEGLAHAHGHGVVHRDLKPENLLLDTTAPGAPVKIADFGIARLAAGTRLTGTDRIIGTPAYMSPEQAMAQPMDGRTDLYTAGVILYELVTGRNPFAGDSPMSTLQNVITGGARALGEVEPAVPLVVDVVVARLLALRPDDRYATAADVLTALQPVVARAQAGRAAWVDVAAGGPIEPVFAREASAWASLARAELQDDARSACAAFSAFRATSQNPDHADARGVLSSLEARGKRYRFTRSTTPAILAAERGIDGKPVDARRAAYRALGDACFDEHNPRFASQWWRRAVKEFGADAVDLARLAKVTPARELAELPGADSAAPNQKATRQGRAWKAAAQATPENADPAHAPALATTQNSTADATSTAAQSAANSAKSSAPLPPWALPAGVAVVLLLLLAFFAGSLFGGGS